MSAVLVIIADVIAEEPLQMRFFQGNHMIQQIVPAAFHPALGDPVLPRALK
jgi:hypothetical protein